MVALLSPSLKLPPLRNPNKERQAAASLSILFKEVKKSNERTIISPSRSRIGGKAL